MTDPELYYQMWKQEHGERMRTVARRREAREASRFRLAARRNLPTGEPLSAQSSRLRLVVDRFLRRCPAGDALVIESER